MQAIQTPRATSSSALSSGAYDLFYQSPPVGEANLEELEQFGVDRLKVLGDISAAVTQALKAEEFSKRITEVVRKYLHMSLPPTGEELRKDRLSHWMLRLVFCKSEEKRWFINQEAALLRFRLQDEKDLGPFLRASNLRYPTVEAGEFEELKEELAQVRGEGAQSDHEARFYHRMGWEEGMDLVQRRQVLVRHGLIYVHKTQLLNIISARFKTSLAEALDHTSRALPQLQQDERLAELIRCLGTSHHISDYKPRSLSGAVSIRDIDSLAKSSFPLCMRHLHHKLRELHHLRHMGRLQYGLFLKGIGLSLDDALEFWRQEFTRVMESQKFDRQYSYNIRHNYGREGKRTDYTPFSCAKIILGPPPGPGEHHGCPFRHHDLPLLQAELAAAGGGGGALSAASVAAIVELVKGANYQIACRKHFELTHGSAPLDLVITHPNKYFEASVALGREKAGGGGTKTDGTATTASKQQGGGYARVVKAEDVKGSGGLGEKKATTSEGNTAPEGGGGDGGGGAKQAEADGAGGRHSDT